jgi:dihydropyrimidinase
MTVEKVVINGRIVIPEIGVIDGSLVIRDGKVVEIRQAGDIQADEVIDAGGRYVLPGLIDPHVHSGLLPPLSQRLEAESAFAASGGITTVIRYFRRPESYIGTLPAQVELGARHMYQDFAHHLALFTREQVSEMGRYVTELGVTSFKLYMNLKGPFGKGFLMDLVPERGDALDTADVDFDDGHLYDTFRTAAALPQKVRINVHCEDAEIVLRETEAVKGAGLDGLPAWHAARPDRSEAIALQMVGYLSRQFDVPVYFPHIGSRAGVEAVAELRAKGTNYGAETGPQYVALDVESDCGNLAKVMPPVRTSDDVVAVWRGIAEGHLTSFGSDHIAYTLEEKTGDSIWNTRPAFGGTGMILPIFLSEGVATGRMTIRQIAELGSMNTARAFGLYPRKGTLLPGADADFVIVDLEREWSVRADELLSASDFSVYEGKQLTGSIHLTAVRGEVVYRDGQMVGEPGYGRFYRRYPSIEGVAEVGS